MDTELHPHRHHYRLLIVVFFIAISILALALYGYSSKTGVFRQPIAATTSTVMAGIGPAMNGGAKQNLQDIFRLQGFVNHQSVKRGQLVDITVAANAPDRTVRGYDVLIDLRGAPYKVKSVTSELSDFTVLKFAKPTHITVTGVKDYGAKGDTVFAGQKVFTLTVEALNDGVFDVQILASKGRESTKIVSVGDSVRDLMPVYAKGSE